MRFRSWSGAAVSLALIAVGCGDSTLSRPEVVEALSADVMVQTYEQLAEIGDELMAATTALCDGGSGDTDVARAAVADSRMAWSRSESIWLGPVMERRSWALVDWPISTERVDELLADDSEELNADLIGTRVGADVRGLGAYEYLLSDWSDGDERRCDHLVAIATTITDELTAVRDGWTESFEDGDPYGEQVVADAEATLDALVNDSLFLLEAMADLELGAALGITRSEADPTAIHEGPDGLGVADLIAHLDGIDAVYDGLSPLLSDDLVERLAAAIDAAVSDTELIDAPLMDAVVATPDVVEQARDSIKAVQVLVGTEVVSELGVTIGFSDADGDTGA